ncbi:MAG: hypothetical protein EOO36_04190 [Cytophagaceae bacterium]|nr:MAG: hypothetical protein EOO36_04190 [Cytophagaceae bacterium]
MQLLAAKVLTITPAKARAFLMSTTLEKVAGPIHPFLPPKPTNQKQPLPAARPKPPAAQKPPKNLRQLPHRRHQ